MKLEKSISHETKIKNQITKVKALIFIAAGLSFLLSIFIYFSGDKQNGIYVGLWVPSILSAGILLLGGKNNG
jgi:hypothetical protein